jgi:hypothetical protein
MSGTKAKFYLSGLTLLPGKNAGIQLALSAVARGDRNASWAQATPIGNLTMTVNNPVAIAWWENFMQDARRSGKQPELFMDLYPSEDGWPGDGHKFRLADIPEGVYGHGTCGECGVALDADVKVWNEASNALVSTGQAHPNG